METEMWFDSEKGIRKHFRDEREAERKAYEEKLTRLGQSEDDFIDAFRKTRGKK